jgi:hypothetical protein
MTQNTGSATETPMDKPAIQGGVERGIRWAVLRSPIGGCNGYVKLPTGYPKAWGTYDDIDVDVHGGLTYGPDEEGWVGFDTAHLGDVWVGSIPDDLDSHSRDFLTRPPFGDYRREWDEDKVAAETRRLAHRLADLIEER